MSDLENWPTLLTRHLSLERKTEAKLGVLSFGTTKMYRSGGIGRFSDMGEGVSEHRLSPRFGRPTIIESLKTSNGSILSNVAIIGFGPSSPAPISFSHEFNDYVICLSNGPFHRVRAEEIRKSGNADLLGYVTYDSSRLKSSVIHTLAELFQTQVFEGSELELVGRKVTYADRANQILIPDRLRGAFVKLDDPESWYRSVFYKPVDYSFEDEFRIAFNQTGWGLLPPDALRLTIESKLIRDSIVHCGNF